MLGGLDILFNGESIINKMSSKAAGLLCYLALNQGNPITRDKLAEILWDSSNMDSARYNLRYTLWSIKKLIKSEFDEEEVIVNSKNGCRLNTYIEVNSDVVFMLKAFDSINKNDVKIEKLEEIRNVYKGEFLEGFEIKSCFKLNDWIFYERENLQRKYFQVLQLLANEYREKQKYNNCIEICEKMLLINPLMEELYVELIKIYLEIGDRNAALSQYERCCEVLREELNMAPMESTKQVYHEIKRYSKKCATVMLESNKTQESSIHCTILYTYDDEKFWREYEKKQESIKIITNCIPIVNLEYYWLWETFESIINNCENAKLKTIPEHYWMDISRIHTKTLEFCSMNASVGNLTSSTEKVRIFTSAIEIIRRLCESSRLTIFINNFHNMDNISFEYFMFMLFNSHKLNLGFYIYTIEGDEKLNQLVKHFDVRMRYV
jgi:DNA-binding SARP family transcriptional activator